MKCLLFLCFAFVLTSCTIKLNDSNDDGGGNGNNNGPPPPPSCIQPANMDTGVVLTPMLIWMCNSYTGEPIVYDVYLDTIMPPALIAHDISSTSYYVYELLQGNRIYYWEVRSRNDYGSSSSGTMYFTTTSMVPDAGSVFKKQR